MTTSTRIKENGIKALFILVLFAGLVLKSCMVTAQSFKPAKYLGFEGTFGVRSFTLSSDIAQLDQLNVVQEGGNAGIVYGVAGLRGKLRLAGFYYSSAQTSRTINGFETEGLVNFYPLELGKYTSGSKVQPYILGGATYNNIKFFGHYLNENDKPINYSDPREPKLGAISVVNLSVGAGMEWKLVDDYNFVHLFGELKYGIPVVQNASNAAFANTTVAKYMAVNVGVAFGMFR